jgi:fluoroacetyl-CoA thioesterase
VRWERASRCFIWRPRLSAGIVAEAQVTQVDRRRIEFKIDATDRGASIGTGTHERIVVDMARFIERLNQNRA